jgi:anti-anti-sigma factor
VYAGLGIALIPVGTLRSARVLTRVFGEDRTVVFIDGSLDLDTVPDVRDHLLRVSPGPGVPLLLDLSGVTFCDAIGLGLLVAAERRARIRGGALFLVAPSPAVVEAMKTAGLSRLIPVLPATIGAAGSEAGDISGSELGEAA